MCLCVCICVNVCAHVRGIVREWVCVYARTFVVGLFVYMNVFAFVCVYVRVCACVCVHVRVFMFVSHVAHLDESCRTHR